MPLGMGVSAKITDKKGVDKNVQSNANVTK